jgi:ATP-binding cassette subfamily G (WHITE) protein 2 (SNQ2)
MDVLAVSSPLNPFRSSQKKSRQEQEKEHQLIYYRTPFHYLLEGLLGAVTHGVQVTCASNEYAYFSAPPGQTCASYTQDYVAQAGGYVRTAASGLCEFCQYANGSEFAASFNVYYSHKWRDYGIFWAYCIFNFAVVFACSWLYLGGMRRIISALSPQARKAKKASRKEESG